MHTFFANYLKNIEEIHNDIHVAISGLSREALDWTPGSGMNSLSVMVIHLIGAERYWIGDVIVGEPSDRDRESEFRVQGFSESDLLEKLAEFERYVQKALEAISVNVLEEKRVSPRNGREVTAGWALCHALKHTALHVGQIQIMRQLWEQRSLN